MPRRNEGEKPKSLPRPSPACRRPCLRPCLLYIFQNDVPHLSAETSGGVREQTTELLMKGWFRVYVHHPERITVHQLNLILAMMLK
jgi:hypothetical protein